MAKGNKLSDFEKGKITTPKRVGKSQREISKALRPSKTVICNYLKSQNNYGTRKPISRLEKLSPHFKRRIVHEVKKNTLSTSKILKSPVNAPGSSRTIRRHWNSEKLIIRNEFIVEGQLWTTKRNVWNMLVNIKLWVVKNGGKVFSQPKRNSI